MLRTNALATLLVHRLTIVGPMPENAALDALDSRSPGRALETIEWAIARQLIRRVEHNGEPMLEAAGAARALRTVA